MRVTVDGSALDALIGYANDQRLRADREFACSREEEEASLEEFDALVGAVMLEAVHE